MNTFIWIVIIMLSVALGIALLQYLVAPPLQMAVFLVLCVLLGVGLVLIVSFGLSGLVEGSRCWCYPGWLRSWISGSHVHFPEPGRTAPPSRA